jgi:hypothetical protein
VEVDEGETLRRDYGGLVVTGRCGAIDRSRSEIVLYEYPAGWFPDGRGLFFAEDSWDGTDVFMADDETGYIFVTDRVRRALAKTANVMFEAAAEVRIPDVALWDEPPET